MIDKQASDRLLKEVRRLYLDRSGQTKFSVLALSDWSHVNREPLRRYLQLGNFPDPDVLGQLATALGVPANRLWSTWFGLGSSDDALVRIAEALERAYPRPDEVREGMARADTTDRELEAHESRSKRRAPRASTGSAG